MFVLAFPGARVHAILLNRTPMTSVSILALPVVCRYVCACASIFRPGNASRHHGRHRTRGAATGLEARDSWVWIGI